MEWYRNSECEKMAAETRTTDDDVCTGGEE